MKNFALIGAAGYIAPRHLKAIKETGNRVICALDPHDSVGIIDSYFPDAAFFSEFERFDRHVSKLSNLDYLSICSPNYLHDAHIRWALRSGCNVICEKPLGLNPENVEALAELEKQSGKIVSTILQLRLHPEVIRLKEQQLGNRHHQGKRKKVELTYITPRGLWYDYSWKGDITKSGGIATNIGIHLFDLLIWLFGEVQESQLHLKGPRKMSGFLQLERADVRWLLSIDPSDGTGASNRSLSIDEVAFNFSEGFSDLHTLSYQNVLNGNGFGITDALPAIEVVHQIRQASAGDHLAL